jgi:energy-coupling factor transporter transmembrane protein EcfT
MKKGHYFVSFVIALIFGILAIFIPSIFLKVVFSLIAIVVFAMNFTKHKVLFVILAVVFFIIPASIFLNFMNQHEWGNLWNNLLENDGNYYRNYNYNYNKGNNTITIEPDRYIEGAEHLEIKGKNYEIIFDNTSDQIYIPNRVRERRNQDVLTLTYNGMENEKVVIIVGTKNPYKSIKIDSTAVVIKGDLKVEDFYINATGVSCNANIFASTLVIEAIGLTINNDIHADNVEVRATGITWRGLIEAKEINISGTGMQINLSVIGAENIFIASTAMQLSIKYQDYWSGTRNLTLSGTYGDVTILEPSINEGKIDINTTGKITIRRQKF